MINILGYLPTKRQRIVNKVPSTPLNAKKCSTPLRQEKVVIPRFVIKDGLIGVTAYIPWEVEKSWSWKVGKACLSSISSKTKHHGRVSA